MPRYTVNGRAEEFDCPTCGAPVFTGERAWQDTPEEQPYCSAYCAGYDPRDALRDRLKREAEDRSRALSQD